MMATAPYRLQIFLADEVREVLHEVAHQQRTSQQRLVNAVLIHYLKRFKAGQNLAQPDPHLVIESDGEG